ncbi:MAG TPA: aminopeptidase P N-terminal domain-containing protein [Myxococcota bacterium]|nr:aminopeptidase P N-terminal domain-containing protein [Myxococcota bacterium]
MSIPEADRATYAARRAAVLDKLGPGEAMLLFGARQHIRNGDSEYRYRQLSDLLYLCGWEDPGVAVLLRPDAESPFTMFVQPKDPDREVWTGVREGPEGAKERYGADDAHDYEELQGHLGKLLIGVHTLHYAAGEDPERDRLVLGCLASVRRTAREALQPLPDAFIHPGRLLHEMRLVKGPWELDRLRRAAAITCEAHLAAMKLAAPGVREYELEAFIDYAFRRHGGAGPGYPTIVGGGANACILHYITNREPLRAGELVLVDAGCEYAWYTADITRTLPVSGRFSSAQRELYELVLTTEIEVIEHACPGKARIKDLHDLAIRRLTQGMVELELLAGEVDELIEDKSYRRYYMHGTSHWLGMEVHDVGSYSASGSSRLLEPGMVFTVEPGLYVPPDDEEAPERFRGIGIRIEDDVLVTEDGPEVLTAACPKTVEDVEEACA